jgi:hypothetical protein
VAVVIVVVLDGAPRALTEFEVKKLKPVFFVKKLVKVGEEPKRPPLLEPVIGLICPPPAPALSPPRPPPPPPAPHATPPPSAPIGL